MVFFYCLFPPFFPLGAPAVTFFGKVGSFWPAGLSRPGGHAPFFAFVVLFFDFFRHACRLFPDRGRVGHFTLLFFPLGVSSCTHRPAILKLPRFASCGLCVPSRRRRNPSFPFLPRHQVAQLPACFFESWLPFGRLFSLPLSVVFFFFLELGNPTLQLFFCARSTRCFSAELPSFVGFPELMFQNAQALSPNPSSGVLGLPPPDPKPVFFVPSFELSFFCRTSGTRSFLPFRDN